jgi:hypothetical protein
LRHTTARRGVAAVRRRGTRTKGRLAAGRRLIKTMYSRSRHARTSRADAQNSTKAREQD